MRADELARASGSTLRRIARSTPARAGLALCAIASAQGQSLSSTFAGGQSVAGNTFTLSAQRPITLVGFDLNIAASGSANTVSCFYRPFGIGGQETNPVQWFSLGADPNVVSAGAGLPSRARFSGVELTPGQAPGFYLDLTSSSSGSTSILGATPGASPFANADLTFTPNSAQGSPAFSSTTPGVMWNGRVNYKPTAACVRQTTQFAGGNNFRGNTFDIKGVNPVTITGFDVNLDGAGSTNTIAVYYKLGTAAGFESTPGAWTLLGTDPNVVSAGINQPSHVRVGGLEIAAGQTYGIYVDLASYDGTTLLHYTTTSGTFGFRDIQIVGGTGQGDPPFTTVFPTRLWNGSVYYAPTPAIGALDTSFSSDGGASGSMFDLTPARDLDLDGIDVNIAGAGPTSSVTIRYRTGSSVGFESTSAGWTLLGTDTAAVSPGQDGATPVRVRGARLLAGQTYGVYVSLNSGGTLRSLAGPHSYTNADLSLASNCDKGAPLFTGATTSSRAFSGRIYYHTAGCYPNCDGSTGAPLLGAGDFVCFLSKFRAGDAYANCDGSTVAPTLGAADFVCFLSKFRAGCP